MSTALSSLRVQIYADGADPAAIRRNAAKGHVSGLTTNPSLLAKAGVTDYPAFCRDAVEAANGKSISFEVLEGADLDIMRTQALTLDSFGSAGHPVYVKIPCLTTAGVSTAGLVQQLRGSGVLVNVTAVTTRAQLLAVFAALAPAGSLPAIVSIFAGRIADRGHDPCNLIRSAVWHANGQANTLILWASTREALNIRQADACACDIITVPDSLLEKAEKEFGFPVDGDDMTESVVRQFAKDGANSGLIL